MSLYNYKNYQNKIKLNNMDWNLKNNKNKFFRLMGYQKDDNLDILNIPTTDSIPNDYDGLMGVPVSYLNRHNSKLFKIIEIKNSLSINNKKTFKRLIIQKISDKLDEKFEQKQQELNFE